MEKSASTDEMLDLFSLRTSAFPPLHSINHQGSFNGIHGVISRMNPQILKSPIASGSMSSSMPVYVPFQRSRGGIESSEVKAPLTIFYNGTVTVFDLPGRKVGDILKLAVSGGRSGQMDRIDTAGAIPAGELREFLGTLTGGEDLPMARRISLQRFLEKRKQRLFSASSYSRK